MGSHFKPIRVMLVNDFPIVGWGLERLVESRQPAMVLAGSATTRADALRALKKAAPDVVLVDIDGDHGPDTIKDLLAAGDSVKILVLTGSADASELDGAVLAGASGVVRKTEPVEALLKAIERVHQGEIWVDRAAAGRIFVELARRNAGQAQNPEQDKIARLTRKERKTVAEIGRDASATGREIAERLHISEHTLRNHLTSIYAKLELASRLELYAYAIRHGILEA